MSEIVGSSVYVEVENKSRKTWRKIGYIRIDLGDKIVVNIDEKKKRKYGNKPGWWMPGGLFTFNKNDVKIK